MDRTRRRRGRWLSPWARARRVLGINARNLLYVHALNPRRHFPLADDKILTKEALAAAGVPVPPTEAVLSNLIEISHARDRLLALREFVVKPACGRQGGGIVVVSGVTDGRFITAGERALAWEDLRGAMGDILFGVHSIGQADRVLVERRVRAHPDLGGLACAGLPDIRVILLHARPAMAMMRVPTSASGGRANLHQGALGVGLRLRDGWAHRCVASRARPVATHPESGVPMTDFTLPFWREVLGVAQAAARALPLPYVGVDVVLDAATGPLVMEVNVRPGLEIQNVNGAGLRGRLRRLDMRRAV